VEGVKKKGTKIRKEEGKIEEGRTKEKGG